MDAINPSTDPRFIAAQNLIEYGHAMARLGQAQQEIVVRDVQIEQLKKQIPLSTPGGAGRVSDGAVIVSELDFVSPEG